MSKCGREYHLVILTFNLVKKDEFKVGYSIQDSLVNFINLF